MKTDRTWLIEQDPSGYSSPGRCIFCANSNTFIMAGGPPLLRLAKCRAILGSLRFFDADGKPLDEGESTLYFRAGQAKWQFAGGCISAGAPEDTHGMVVKITCDRPITVRWGGMALLEDGPFGIAPGDDGSFHAVAFDEAYLGESYTAAEGGFNAARPQVDSYLKQLTGGDLRLAVRAGFALRQEAGTLTGTCQGEGYFYAGLLGPGQAAPALPAAYESMLRRADDLCGRLRVKTPLPALDFCCSFAANHQDGIWYPPYHVHSCPAWNVPYLGWTNRYGDALMGWHHRLLTELRHYAQHQIKEDVPCGPAWLADDHKGCVPAAGSRFYGKGYVARDQHFYNMQTQFFDQMIYSWRATGDGEMAAALRPALELHCTWLDECFDPDGDGGYESVIDTWPTDSVWCDGGAAPETTCYAYRAHEAARDLAALAGDSAGAARHEAVLDRIYSGFFKLLWSRELGIAGRCREQGGHGRLLENPWTYSAFLPVEVGLLDQAQAAQSLYYTKWALQNDPAEGGRIVWHSNLVPAVWSVRWAGAHEQSMLAGAYFAAGMPEEGLELLGARAAQGSIEGDGCRAVVNGLFGYRPNYPQGSVLLAPCMPFDWQDASLENPDVKLCYHRDENGITLTYRLPHPARLTVELPVYAQQLLGVEGGTLEGLVPGFGRTVARIDCGVTGQGTLVLRTSSPKAPLLPVSLAAAPGDSLTLPIAGTLLDPQGVTAGHSPTAEGIHIALKDTDGCHWLAVLTGGDMPLYQEYHLTIAPTAARLERQARLHCGIPADAVFQKLDMSGQFNCDVQDIYKQQYLSPRPQTISARIGVDGYSPWTFAFWDCTPPEICLQATGEVKTAAGVPLQVSNEAKNIAFVSLWDNFAASVAIPVNSSAKAVVLLLCGTTNPMQSGGVENLRLTFAYADGSADAVPLRNPHEIWSLCPLMADPTNAGQDTDNDYNYDTTPFCLPVTPPECIQLGQNCRAIALRWQLEESKTLQSITLEAMSKDIVFGVMAVTLVK